MYQVSNLGNVKSVFRYKRVLKPIKDKYGYLKVSLYKDSKGKAFFVHRLVAEAFILNPENKPQINHINGIKSDNRKINLEFCSCSENNQHAYKTGLHKAIKGKKHILAKKINQYDLEGNFIKQWDCIMDIERSLNIKSSNICACCKERRKTLKKYIWKYADTQ